MSENKLIKKNFFVRIELNITSNIAISVLATVWLMKERKETHKNNINNLNDFSQIVTRLTSYYKVKKMYFTKILSLIAFICQLLVQRSFAKAMSQPSLARSKKH